MSEAHRDQADIIQFPTEREHDLLQERIILERFMSQLTHTGLQGHSSRELAAFIIDTSGVRPRENLPEDRLAWRAKVKKIKDTTPGLSNSDYDALADPSSDQYDEGFAILEESLRSTRANPENFEVERHAIFILMDLRVAAIKHRTDDTDKWVKLAKRLAIS